MGGDVLPGADAQPPHLLRIVEQHPDRPGQLPGPVGGDQPDELERLGENAREQIATHLTWDASVSRLRNIYAALPWPTP